MILSLLALAAAQAPSMPSSPDPMPPPRITPSQPATEGPAAPRVPDEIVARFAACTDLLRTNAERAVEGSRGARDRGDAETEASFARSAVFLYFAALEGFINFV